MALTPGTRIGPYEVTALIGVGGMGEVYRATDTNLGRDVAIKVLPDTVAHDPDRIARFEREAKTLAQLNHPNIATIHGVEKSSGVYALVMELVEGPTLADRIAQGRIGVADALPIAKQIAEALEVAHEQGIIHRDLKPANIKLRHDGTVKVLDFGLAKLAHPGSGIGDPGPAVAASMSPTITTPAMTLAGLILGTAAYMSPEQARGRTVDKRTDIWAFGCVLYEMLTGARAFDGEDVADTLGAVIHKVPRWDALPPAVPPTLRASVERCLNKDPKQRIRDIGDVRIELGAANAPPVAAGMEARDTSRSRSWTASAGWAIAAVSTVVVAFLAVGRYGEAPAPAGDPVTFEMFAPENTIVGNSAAVSPDGRHVAFQARGGDGRTSVWVRDLSTLDAHPLPGTEDAVNPVFWSPDSRFIGFVSASSVGNFAGGRLKKVSPSGGPPVTLCDLPGAHNGGAWNSGGTILVAVAVSGIWKVSDGGGTPTRVTSIDQGIQNHRWPTFLPDGDHFLYTGVAAGGANVGDLHVGSLDAAPNQQSARQVLKDQSGALYVPSSDPGLGYVLFARDGSLMAQGFDARRLELAGGAVPVAEGLLQNINALPFSVSTTGVLAFRGASGSDDSILTWFDRQGKDLGQVGPRGRYGDVRLALDGMTLVLDALNAGSSIRHVWTVDIRRGVFGLLNPGGEGETGQTVSPDLRVAFTLNASGDVYVRTANGAGDAELLVKSTAVKHPNDWSRDGRFIIYDDHNPTRRQDLYVVPLAGERKPVPFLVTPADETAAAFSPDGRWIAYSSDESGRRDVYVRDFVPDKVPATGSGKWQMSTAGGDKPRWNPNGRELFYLALDGTMMAVPVASGSALAPGVPAPLFKTNATGFFPYDVATDGRFLVNTRAESPGVQSPITIVLNWESRLKK